MEGSAPDSVGTRSSWLRCYRRVELYARSTEEATEVLEGAARGALAITSLAEESRPPASGGGGGH